MHDIDFESKLYGQMNSKIQKIQIFKNFNLIRFNLIKKKVL